VDVSPEAVADAKRNAAINRITKAEFRAGAVEDLLDDLVRTAQFHDILAIIGEHFQSQLDFLRAF
jgi:tRNA/tmRNA/rRNA uracil-C5-methylase (TrmA/RlmC/RlmD family)